MNVETFIETLKEQLPDIVDEASDGSVYQTGTEDCLGFDETNFIVKLSNGAELQFTVKTLVEADDEGDEWETSAASA